MKHIFTTKYWAKYDMELFIGKILRYGVITSCVITIFGGIIYFIQQDGQMPDYKPVPMDQPFEGTDHYLRELSTIIPRMLSFDGAAIIQFGVCILLATPVMRVFFSVIAFLIEKNYMYVIISLLVLCVILLNRFLGIR